MPTWMGSWPLQPLAVLLGALIAGGIAYSGVARSARKQLRLQYRLKLLEMAHSAVGAVTSEAYEGLLAHQRWRDARNKNDPVEQYRFASHQARGAMQRVSAGLPPELAASFGVLLAAYEAFDDKAAHVHDSGAHQDGMLQPATDFLKCLSAWLTSTREWQRARWKETEGA